jgi:hypothetical protein
MIVANQVLHIIYWLIYLWIVVFCGWNVFTQKSKYRAIGAAMVMVPFILRMLDLR